MANLNLTIPEDTIRKIKEQGKKIATHFRETGVEFGEPERSMDVGLPYRGLPEPRHGKVPDYRFTSIEPEREETIDPVKLDIEIWRQTYYRQQFDEQGKPVNRVMNYEGKELPPGAIAWDYNGEPYFGSDWKGFWKKLAYNFTRAPDKPPEEIVVTRTVAPEAQNQYAVGLYRPTIMPKPKTTIQVIPTIQNLFKTLYAQHGLVGAVARGVQASVKTAFDIASVSAEAAERVVSVAQELEQIGKKSVLPDIAPTRLGQIAAERIGLKPLSEQKKALAALPWNSMPQGLLYNAARAALAPGTFKEKMDRLERAWYAGSILYSMFADEALRSEFDRRYLAGENPYLLARELENPLAELVGEMIIDPLNLFGLGIGKAARESRWLRQGEKLYTHVDPRLMDLLRVAEIGDDAKVAGAFNQSVDIVREIVRATEKGMVEYARPIGFQSAGMKRYYVGRRTGEFMGWLFRHVPDDPEEQIGALKAIMNLVSDDPADILEGMSYAAHFPSPRPFFSQAGIETGILIRNALKNEDGVVDATKFLDELRAAQKEGIEEVIKLATRRMERTVEEMFPTVVERIAAGERVPAWMKALARSERIMSRAYRVPNTFFAGVYMGLSPGYASRNLITNSLHVAVDQGISALFVSPSDALRRTDEILRGVPLSMGGFGRGLAGIDVAPVIAGKERAESLTNIWKLIKERPATPMLAVSEKFEEWGAAQTIYAATKRTFYRLFKPGKAIPDLRILTNNGFSQSQANRLAQLIVDNKGDVDKAIDVFRNEMKLGNHPLFRDLSVIDPDDLVALRDFNLDDKLAEILRTATSPEDAARRITELFDELIASGKRVANELPLVDEANPDLQDVFAAVGDLSDREISAVSNYVQANRNSMTALETAIQKTLEGRILQAPDAPETQQFMEAWSMAREAANDLARQADEFGDRWHATKRAYDAAEHTAENMNRWWQEMGMKSEPPKTWSEFKRRFWWEFYYPSRHQYWAQVRQLYVEAANTAQRLFGENQLIASALKESALADIYDKNVVNYQRIVYALQDAIRQGRNKEAALLTAEKYGMPSASEKGIPLDKRILSAINDNLPRGTKPFESLDDVPPQTAEKAFQRWARKKAGLEEAEAIPVPYAGNMPTEARVVSEQSDGLVVLRDHILDAVRSKWGTYEPGKATPAMEKALAAFVKEAQKRAAEARLLIAHVANANRDFTMLPYQAKSYLDLALAYIYPYHFWYTHTYYNWLRRIASDPHVLAAYAKYKNTLAKIHAGAPEWWKYNVNTNELLGLDSDNPLFFNLEQTLNPLHGLTGVDFEDKEKNIDWWTTTLDNLGKLGPSTWTPFSLATAVALKIKGEDEAAARWAGRLIPQTATLKAALALGGVKIRTGSGINEFDPAVWFFSNGLDPYERNRAGRALALLQQEYGFTDAEILDIARQQNDPMWYEAVYRAITQRAWGQLASFTFGTGFKARSRTDMQIDQMYADWRRLWNMKDLMSPEQFRDSMARLREAYPFMDAVMLSRKGTEERDRAYAYNVMSRIPPGQLDDVSRLLGVKSELLKKFWDDKGDMDDWAESDRARFLAAMVDLGAFFEMPDYATRKEWNEAKTRYNALLEEGRRLYGEDIWDRENAYYSAKAESSNREAAEAILNADPDLQRALDWKQSQILGDPLLSRYYTSMSRVEQYYKGQMARLIEEKIGVSVDQMFDEYNSLRLTDKKKASEYYKKYVKNYYEWRDWYEKAVGESLGRIAEGLTDPIYPRIRPGAGNVSLGTKALERAQEKPETIYDRSWSDWRRELSVPLANLIEDYAVDGKPMPAAAMKQLDFIAEQYRLDDDILLEIIADSIRRGY